MADPRSRIASKLRASVTPKPAPVTPHPTVATEVRQLDLIAKMRNWDRAKLNAMARDHLDLDVSHLDLEDALARVAAAAEIDAPRRKPATKSAAERYSDSVNRTIARWMTSWDDDHRRDSFFDHRHGL